MSGLIRFIIPIITRITIPGMIPGIMTHGTGMADSTAAGDMPVMIIITAIVITGIIVADGGRAIIITGRVEEAVMLLTIIPGKPGPTNNLA